MRITDIERIAVELPHKPRPGYHMKSKGDSVSMYPHWPILELCKVTTDTGLVGWGETLANYTQLPVTDQAVQRAMGRNPGDLLWDDSLGMGLQEALFDVTGKALGVPAYRLIGPKVRDWAPLSWWCVDMPADDWVAETQEALAAGYVSFKFKTRPWHDIRAQLEAISAATPDHATFGLDFNEWLGTVGCAERVLPELEAFPKVRVFESPLPQRDVAGNRSLRGKIHRPIAMHFDNPPFLTAVQEGVCDAFVISGGAAAMRRQAGLAAEANLPFWLQIIGAGISTAYTAQLVAAFRAAQIPSVTCLNTYVDDLIVEPLRIERGYVRVPEAPGLGIEVDEDMVERLRRPDTGKRPLPRAIHTVRWTDGRSAAYTTVSVYERDFLDGNQPLFEPGVELGYQEDDSSVEFNDRHAHIDQAGCVVTNA